MIYQLEALEGSVTGVREIRLELVGDQTGACGVMGMPQLRQQECREGARDVPEIEYTGLGESKKEEQLVGLG